MVVRIAFVTGAAQGLGHAVAEAFLAEPTIQGVVFTDASDTVTTCVEDPRALCMKVDVTKREDLEAAFEQCKEKFGHYPNIVVCNAGILRPSRFLDISFEEWRTVNSVNVDGVFSTMQLGCKYMLKEKADARGDGFYGRIITMASQAGRSVSKLGGAHYTSSKHAVIGLTRAAAFEMGEHNITCNAICPGVCDTAMAWTQFEAKDGSARNDRASVERTIPMRRIGEVKEVAHVATFLASPGSSYMTGACLDVNGGNLMV